MGIVYRDEMQVHPSEGKKHPLSNLNLTQRMAAGGDWPYLGVTMVGMKRLDNIRELLETVVREDIPGDVMETGVWRGN